MAQDVLKADRALEISGPAREVLTKALIWMFGGMVLAAFGAWAVGGLESLKTLVASYPIQSLVLLGVWLVLTIGFKPLVRILPAPLGAALFIIYSLLTGVSLTAALAQYTTASLVIAFGAAVLLFGSMTLFALFTKIDLGNIRFFVLAGGAAALVFTAVNALFFRSSVLEWLISIGMLLVFAFSTASSVQSIKAMAEENDPTLKNRLVIIGAATLFTNFVGIFMRILRLFGQRRSSK